MLIIINKNMLKLIIAVVLIALVIAVGTILYNRTDDRAVMNMYEEMIPQPIDKGDQASDHIAFACNVDWGNEVIPEMLRVLEEKDVKITFFVTGRWAKSFPSEFQEIIKAGHEIGSHGYHHSDYSKLSLQENKRQIQDSEEVIMKYTNVKPTLFAPPSGAFNENTLKAAEALGYQTILWTIDTIDWRKDSTKDVIIRRVVERDDHGGAIILMHPMPETAKALPNLIEKMAEKGLNVGRVTDVLTK
ncbi:polysaccharide deacetylase [Alkaliphilus metalliredigens QYMF]|uniref:Polysaccharide deacetylase n=1 Tax=Alkaliphilus metalliredigens (strain QYMF) TaxID=293826 RepID=A6TRK0_ALKMQ|nr:polysaccharide deacetylase family protein [Alkaliphilus metalliredigens]ABR48818.1 polysaccharide deacetylase [Alkaliphilus metalliredigens QYMF]